jgi:hypothetical protein
MSNSNTGGRVSFVLNDEVRIINLDGCVSEDAYIVNQTRSDRKGQVELIHKETNVVRKVHHRRILSKGYQDGMAVVLETNGRFYALCPKCGKTEEILPTKDDIICPDCGQFTLHWISAKPDASIYKTKKLTDRKPKKEMSKPTKLNLVTIAKLPNCELWSKIVAFDHEMIDVRAHALIYTAEPCRKYCFNTYDGQLGKKSNKLYLDEFLANSDIDGSKQPWFSITNLSNAKQKLAKSGYTFHKEDE